MASLSFTLATSLTPSCSPSFSQKSLQQRRLKTHVKQTHRFHVSCNVSSDDHEKPLPANPQPQKLILPETSLDRRNLLLGLGGLYSTVNLTGPPSAFAKPIASPSFLKDLAEPSCKEAGSGFNRKKVLNRSTACCPPASKKGPEKNYVLPDPPRKPFIRKPIHTPENDVQKYMDAIEKMRALPDDDPRSFKNQAKIHCAYCNGSYIQNGQELQIHNSWLFFPFHRWYLFFFERIVRHFSGDQNFALPYWNWDNDAGMYIPASFYKENQSDSSKLNYLSYDTYRNAKHLDSNKVVDLDYTGADRTDGYDQKEINRATMNRQMLRNSFDATSFFGGKYVAGNKPIENGVNVVGSIEAGVHTAIHRWVGSPRSNPETPNGEDMGNFYSAGYDPLFYVHHANVDRMWTLWKQMGGKEPDDDDWRNASYVFYDENQNPVRVYNKESVNLDKDYYAYQESSTLNWMGRPPRSRCARPSKEVKPSKESFKNVTESIELRAEPVRIEVKRPEKCKNRSEEEKKREKEILCFDGIKFDCKENARFDVYVNECGDDLKVFTPCDSENVGSFGAIPHSKGMEMDCSSGMRFSLSELLEETNAEGDDSIRVTIVPRDDKKVTGTITIEKIEIRLIPRLELKSI